MVRSRWIGAVAGVLTSLAPAAIAQTSMTPNQVVNVREGDKPARKCKVVKVTTDKAGNKACEVEALDNGEKMTIVEAASGKGGMRVFRNPGAASTGGSGLAGLFGRGTKPAPTPATPTVTETTVAARPSNWRESWGKVERWTEADSKQAAETASQRAETAGRSSLPVATPQAADPLVAPEQFTNNNLPSSLPPLPGAAVVSGPTPAESETKPVTTELPAPNLSEAKPASKRSWFAGRAGKEKEVTAPTETVTEGGPLPVPMPKPRFGSASVAAATEEVRPARGKKPSTMGNAMSLPPTPAYSDARTGDNAFSAGAPSRPIPSDMGPGGPPRAMMAGGMMPPLPPQPLTPAMRQQMMMAAIAQQQQHQAVAMQVAMAQQQQMAVAHQQAMQQAIQRAERVNTTPKLLADLRDSLLPSEREMAVDRLRLMDWKAEPEVLQGLTAAAKADPSPAVRLACVRALGHMKADTYPVIQTLEELKQDADARVREESLSASEALTRKK
ncbi:MAG: HEAT repeat domain-containing protein [Gemmataceae bacterium]